MSHCMAGYLSSPGIPLHEFISFLSCNRSAPLCSVHFYKNKLIDLRNYSTIPSHSANLILKITSQPELDLTFNFLDSPMVSASSLYYFHNILVHLYILSVSPISSPFLAEDTLRFIFYGRSTIDSKMIHAVNQSQSTCSACGGLLSEWLIWKVGMAAVTNVFHVLDFSLRFRLFHNMILLCHEHLSRFPSSRMLYHHAKADFDR
jgi:hypothetical protein